MRGEGREKNDSSHAFQYKKRSEGVSTVSSISRKVKRREHGAPAPTGDKGITALATLRIRREVVAQNCYPSLTTQRLIHVRRAKSRPPFYAFAEEGKGMLVRTPCFCLPPRKGKKGAEFSRLEINKKKKRRFYFITRGGGKSGPHEISRYAEKKEKKSGQ